MTGAYCREQAANCGRAADLATLQNVRDSQRRAQEVWLAMAATAEQVEQRRAKADRARAAKVSL